jgi:hypothetical protein
VQFCAYDSAKFAATAMVYVNVTAVVLSQPDELDGARRHFVHS